MLSGDDEIRRLEGAQVDRPASGVLVNFTFTAHDSAGVLQRIQSALLLVLSLSGSEIDEEASCPKRLPSWLVASFAPEKTEEELAIWLAWWRGLDADARARAEETNPWTLPNWLYWMTPEERSWRWWSAILTSPTSAIVTIEVLDWPTPIGALRWLMRAAGAEAIADE